MILSGSIRENLSYGRHEIPASDSELEKIATRAHVSEFIERFPKDGKPRLASVASNSQVGKNNASPSPEHSYETLKS